MQRMYAAAGNSVATALMAAINAQAVGFGVTDAAVLPPGPNLATLGDGDDAELVYYAAIEDDVLCGCVRGFDGTVAQAWPAGTPVYRAYTAYDHDAFVANIDALAAQKLAADGDGTALTADFEAVQAREAVQGGLSLGTLFGRIGRWLADLRGAAFMDVGTAAGTVAAGNHAHSGVYGRVPRSENTNLLASGWVDGEYTLRAGIFDSQQAVGRIAVSYRATDAQYEAFAQARIRAVGQDTALVRLRCLGQAPAVDIPITLEVYG